MLVWLFAADRWCETPPVLCLLKVCTGSEQLHKFMEEKSIENYQICRNSILLRKSWAKNVWRLGKYDEEVLCTPALSLHSALGICSWLLLQTGSGGRWDVVSTMWSEHFCVLMFISLGYSRHRRTSRKYVVFSVCASSNVQQVI